jgi:hypothetical protein
MIPGDCSRTRAATDGWDEEFSVTTGIDRLYARAAASMNAGKPLLSSSAMRWTA